MSSDSVFSGLWRFATTGVTEPDAGTFGWDDDLTPTQVAVSHLDMDDCNRSEAIGELIAGDTLTLRTIESADPLVVFTVTAWADEDGGGWSTIDVTIVGDPPASPPDAGDRVLFDVSRQVLEPVGPISTLLSTVVGRVADNLHGDPADTWIISAVDAAVEYVTVWTNRETLGLPDDPLTVNGLVGFATRIYLDAFTPGGAQVAVVDPSFVPIYQPEHLFKHWRHYFNRLDVAWGVA